MQKSFSHVRGYMRYIETSKTTALAINERRQKLWSLLTKDIRNCQRTQCRPLYYKQRYQILNFTVSELFE
jgi:hypothetical protein